MFILNNNEVKMWLKDAMLISGLRVVSINFIPMEAQQPSFRDRYFPKCKRKKIELLGNQSNHLS